MAIKDYVVFMNHREAAETSTMVDLMGNKIFDIINYGSSDYGNYYWQPAAGEPFYVTGWDGSVVKIGLEGESLSGIKMLFSNYSQSFARKVAFDTATGDVYWLSTDFENADRTTLWRANAALTQLGRPEIFDYVGSGDPLFDTVQADLTNSTWIFEFEGVRRLFGLYVTSSVLRLLSRPLTGGAWTEHTMPNVFPADFQRMTLIGTNLVLTVTNVARSSAEPTFYTAPLSTMIFDSGTLVPGVVTSSVTYTSMTEWGGPSILGDSLYFSGEIDNISHVMKFNASTKIITATIVSATPIDVTLSGVRYTISQPTTNINKDTSPLSDGRWVTHAVRWATHDNTAVSTDCLVIVSSDFSTIQSELYAANNGGSPGESNQWLYGVATLQFDTYEVTGTVTDSIPSPLSGVKMGILGSGGKINTTTSTDGSGNYTLTCLNGLPKHVVAWAAGGSNGSSQVHTVTPVAVP